MAGLSTLIFVLFMLYCASGKPVGFEGENILEEHSPRPQNEPHPNHKFKRFINQALTSGGFADRGLAKMRTKRGKENAQLWDHHSHSVADCERRFSDCA